MKTSIKDLNPRLYKHYENQSSSYEGIQARMVERLEPTLKFIKTKRGIIKLRLFNIIKKP